MTRLMDSVPMLLKTWCARITRSRMTIAFFLFVLANCAAQTTLHTGIFLCFTRGRELVNSVTVAAGVRRGFTIFQNGILEICSGIPAVHGTTCYTVYNGSTVSTPLPASMQIMQCAEGLTWLENYLCDSKSEEVVYLVLQSWLVVISLFALADESIPNLIVVLAAQVVNTGWISYRVTSDISAKRIYDRVIIDGTCGGFDILGGSWEHDTFLVTLGCSIVALLGTLFFVLKLVKLYVKGTLSSVGSSPAIDRLLKWRLWMRVFLQFTAFFALASAAIWHDKLTGMIAPYSKNILYDAGFYVVVIILLPWLVLGIYSISNEKRFLFLIYAFLSMCLLVNSVLRFGSALFRYEYGAWRTFAGVTTMADVLLVITCVLSVICRLNFGRGLAQFLIVERALQASGFARDIFRHGSSDPSSCASLARSKQAMSADSAKSPVFAAWLSSQGGGDREKSQQHAVKQETQSSIIIISRETMKPCDVQSVSDHESITTVT